MLDRVTARISNLFKIAAGVALIIMMLLTCLDAFLRDINKPITGVVEIVTYLGALVLAFSLPMTQERRGQVGVALLTRKMPPRVASVLEFITDGVSVVLCAVIAWQGWIYAERLALVNEKSMNLGIPTDLVVRAICISFAALCLVLLNQMAAAIGRAVRK